MVALTGDGGGQERQDVGVSMAGQGGDRHGVKAGVLAGRGADVGVRVDPQDRQVVPVSAGERGEPAESAPPSPQAKPIVLV